eukprot:765609-Hanusia_phi.AAC.2
MKLALKEKDGKGNDGTKEYHNGELRLRSKERRTKKEREGDVDVHLPSKSRIFDSHHLPQAWLNDLRRAQHQHSVIGA